MREKKKIVSLSKQSKNNSMGSYHWSYPFDCALMNKQKFNNYKNLSATNKEKYIDTVTKLLVTPDIDQSIPKSIDLSISKPKQFKILFTYLNPDNVEPSIFTQVGYISSYFNGMNSIIKTETYDTILNFIVDSIDIYGLGFTLQFMANCFKRANDLSLDEFTRLSSVFNKMYNFNPQSRVINLDQLLDEYESVLFENGVLGRIGKSFENNMLVNKPPMPVNIMKEAIKEENSAPKHLSPELQKFADLDVIQVARRCSEDKEFNPATNRCLKKCNLGFERNSKFRCIKTKRNRLRSMNSNSKTIRSRSNNSRSKTIRSRSYKRCPEEKELHRKTNRCVKRCYPGYNRNYKFQCRKNVQ
jgi:hypothetical protein